MITVLLFLFFQTSIQNPIPPQGSNVITLAEAEQYIAKKSDAAKTAVDQEKVWADQIVKRNTEKQQAIDMVKKRYNLDATWTWDDVKKKFVQK